MAEADKIAVEPGTLAVGEPHPAAALAKRYIEEHFTHVELLMWLDSLSSCAIEGNRSAEVCATTLCRLLDGAPVSDRYLLGLSWILRNVKEGHAP